MTNSSETPQTLLNKLIDAGYSQTYIENWTGISQPTISRIRSGKHADPYSSTFTKLQKFAEAHLPKEGTA